MCYYRIIERLNVMVIFCVPVNFWNSVQGSDCSVHTYCVIHRNVFFKNSKNLLGSTLAFDFFFFSWGTFKCKYSFTGVLRDMKEWFNTDTIYIYNIHSMGIYIGLKIDSCTLGPRSSRCSFFIYHSYLDNLDSYLVLVHHSEWRITLKNIPNYFRYILKWNKLWFRSAPQKHDVY